MNEWYYFEWRTNLGSLLFAFLNRFQIRVLSIIISKLSDLRTLITHNKYIHTKSNSKKIVTQKQHTRTRYLFYCFSLSFYFPFSRAVITFVGKCTCVCVCVFVFRTILSHTCSDILNQNFLLCCFEEVHHDMKQIYSRYG